MNQTRRYTLAGACLFLLLLPSCIREDLSRCENSTTENSLKVRFVSDTGPINPNDLKNICLFIFDRDNILAGVWKENTPLLDADYATNILLEAGTYSFVAWVNAPSTAYGLTPPYPSDDLIGILKREDFELRANVPNNRTLTTKLPLLMYGHLENAAVSARGSGDTFVIRLQQMSNRLSITAESSMWGTDNYQISVEDNNANYTFNNSLASCESFAYGTEASDPQQTGVLNASLTVLQMEKNRPNPVLKIRNLNLETDWIQCNLIQKILEDLPDTDFAVTHDYHIHIRFEASGEIDVSITVDISNWDSDHSDTILDF
ncbi:MAG: FimB/Mfa2 family fimbrial subunit [Dysgonamonadaceae bacterium]|nr:FimB/Mfa2 family fimbrial subunit [Dysgonamonadaceae bacterium]